jgi:hypothetical protein
MRKCKFRIGVNWQGVLKQKDITQGLDASITTMTILFFIEHCFVQTDATSLSLASNLPFQNTVLSQFGGVQTGLIWLRIGTGGGLLCLR